MAFKWRICTPDIMSADIQNTDEALNCICKSLAVLNAYLLEFTISIYLLNAHFMANFDIGEASKAKQFEQEMKYLLM